MAEPSAGDRPWIPAWNRGIESSAGELGATLEVAIPLVGKSCDTGDTGIAFAGVTIAGCALLT